MYGTMYVYQYYITSYNYAFNYVNEIECQVDN